MKYTIEKIKCEANKYSQSHLFIRVVDNYITVVTEIERATHFHKGSLKKYYRKFGRENLIVRRVKDE